MKRSLFLLAIMAVCVGAQAHVLLDCGRSENFKHEFTLETEPNFSSQAGQWSFYQFGRKVNAAGWSVKAEGRSGVFTGYVVVGKDSTQTTEYVFKNFKGCYQESDDPAALVVFKSNADGTNRRLARATTCHCQMW